MEKQEIRYSRGCLGKAVLIVIIGLMALSISACAQNKKKTVNKPKNKPQWEETGANVLFLHNSDTTYKFFRRIGKDSSSYESSYNSVRGLTFSYPDKNGKLLYKPCDSLETKDWTDWSWEYVKEYIYVKGIKIKEMHPKWIKVQGIGTVSNEYYYNKKRIYPVEIFKHPKLK